MWRCLAKVIALPPKKVPIEPKTVDCRFISYAHNNSAYRFLVHKSDIPDIHVNTIMESRNSSFFELTFPRKNKQYPKRTLKERDVMTSSYEASTSGSSVIDAEEMKDETRRSKRARKEKSYGEDFIMLVLSENEPKILH